MVTHHHPPNQTQKMYLKAEAILKYLLEKSEKIDTLITCKPENVTLITTDLNLYEALGSIKEEDSYNQRRLVKLLETVDIISYKDTAQKKEKPILTEKRVEELRSKVMEVDSDKFDNFGG